MDNLIEILNIYYDKALELIKSNKISKAIELLDKCLKYYSKDEQVLNLMGICQYMLCDFNKAYFYWSKSLIYKTENNRANYYLDVLNSDNFRMIIKKYNLAIDNTNIFKYKDAIRVLEEIKQLNKELIEPYVIIGLCYYELNEYRLAREYIQHALTMDEDNPKYLIYLNQINSKNIPDNKRNISKNNIIAFILVFLLIIVSTLYYQKHNKYIQMTNQATEYQKKMKAFSLDLDTSKTEYNKLKNELENSKHKNSTYSIENGLKNNYINNKRFSGNESEIFKSAILNFQNKKYNEAIDRLQYIVSKGIEENLVAEATYYIAACFEKKEDYKMAEKYYSSYISNFYRKNYYDDSLYNYGLMLYKQGDRDKAKKVLNKLQQEVPNSIFVNSKVRYILNK